MAASDVVGALPGKGTKGETWTGKTAHRLDRWQQVRVLKGAGDRWPVITFYKNPCYKNCTSKNLCERAIKLIKH